MKRLGLNFNSGFIFLYKMNIHQTRLALKALNETTDLKWDISSENWGVYTRVAYETLDPYDFGKRYVLLSQPSYQYSLQSFPEEIRPYISSHRTDQGTVFVYNNSEKFIVPTYVPPNPPSEILVSSSDQMTTEELK